MEQVEKIILWKTIWELTGWILLYFLLILEIDGKSHVFQCGKVYHRTGILWKKSTYTLEKVWVPISQALRIPWISLHFPMLWEIDGETHALPTGWESDGKKHPCYGKSLETCFSKPAFSIQWLLLHFPWYGKVMRKPMYFPCDELYHRIGIRWRKSTHTLSKARVSIFQVLPRWWVLLNFPLLWEIDGKTHAFPLWGDL